MPYKRKKTYRRRKRKLALMKCPMPSRYVTKLRYAEQGVIINPGIGTVSSYTFRANDLFDPDYTSTGHQPRGFDELIAMYNHFTVLGSRITVDFALQPSATYPLDCFIQLAGEPGVSASAIDWHERQDVKSVVISQSGKPTGRLSYNFSAKKFFGPSRPVNDSAQKGSSTASPSELAYYHLGAVAHNAASDPTGLYCSVKIDYIVMFHEAKSVGQS